MSMAESLALASLLAHIKPRHAVEIGTMEGGSLDIISHFSERVESIDINPDCAKLSGRYNNVRFHTGKSSDIAPSVFAENSDIDFVLVDGDHSCAGVTEDLEIIFKYVQKRDCHVVCHDSMNPEIRTALARFRFADMPHCQYVDYDFVPGILNSVSVWKGTLWGGLAYIRFAAVPRQAGLEVCELCGLQYDVLLQSHNEAMERARLGAG